MCHGLHELRHLDLHPERRQRIRVLHRILPNCPVPDSMSSGMNSDVEERPSLHAGTISPKFDSRSGAARSWLATRLEKSEKMWNKTRKQGQVLGARQVCSARAVRDPTRSDGEQPNTCFPVAQ